MVKPDGEDTLLVQEIHVVTRTCLCRGDEGRKMEDRGTNTDCLMEIVNSISYISLVVLKLQEAVEVIG